jgi:hypothetical protein
MRRTRIRHTVTVPSPGRELSPEVTFAVNLARNAFVEAIVPGVDLSLRASGGEDVAARLGFAGASYTTFVQILAWRSPTSGTKPCARPRRSIRC